MALLAFCQICNTYRSRKNKTEINKKQVTICSKCESNLDRSKKFRVNVPTPEGKRITEVVEGTLTYARKIESKIKTDVSKQKHLNLHKSPKVSDIADLYLKWAKENKKDWRHDESRWRLHIKPVLKYKKMDQVTPMDVTNLLTGMQKYRVTFVKGKGGSPSQKVEVVPSTPSPATKKQVLVLIKRLYNWSVKRGLFFGKNPASKIETPKVNNQVTQCLSHAEIQSLLLTIDDWDNKIAGLIVKFALYTGFRLDEIIGLRWENVDLKNNFISLVDPKGNPVTLPISGEAIKILKLAKENLPFSDCSLVFPNNKGERRVSFGKIWSRIRKASGIKKNFRFHDLRHTFASYLASSGEVDIYTLQKLLNHQDPKMTQRYAHLLDEALRRGANVADKVFVR